MGTGIYNITFFPGIFRAFDPSRAVLRKSRYDFDILYLSEELNNASSLCENERL